MVRYTTIRNFFNRVAQAASGNSVMRQSQTCHHKFNYIWRQSTLPRPSFKLTPAHSGVFDRRCFSLRPALCSAHDSRSDIPSLKNPATKTLSSGQNHSQTNRHDDLEESYDNNTRERVDSAGSANPHLQNYSALFRQLALSLPHGKQPTKQDFLQAATSMWQRMRIRFKWFTIKSFRKFNVDDMSAFLSWFLVGQTLWILVGT